MIDIIFLLIFFICLGGIILIIGRKLFFLSGLDISKIPKERMAKVKKQLLERKIAREMTELKSKGVEFLKIFFFRAQLKLRRALIYLSNTIKFIRRKLKLYK